MSNFILTSACAPVFLPVDEFNEVNYDLIPRYFDYLYKNGVRSILINGGCGEFSSLTNIERQKVLDKWIEVIKDDVQVIVNIGTCNLSDTIELGNHALSSNRIDCIAILPPFYISINDENNLLNYLISVSNGLCKNIPILYYHIPSLSKVDINIEKFLDLVKERQFNQLCAIKYTDTNFDNFLTFINQIKSKNLSINMVCGMDTLLMRAADVGAKSAIVATVNMKSRMINSLLQNPMSDTRASDMLTISGLLNAIIKFSNTQHVSFYGLLKAAAEFYSDIKLGPMKKPYEIDQEKIRKFLELLSERKL